MGYISILCTTIVMVMYIYYNIFKNRILLSHYLTSTGGNKPKVYQMNPYVIVFFILFHFMLMLIIGIFVFNHEYDNGILIRIFVSIDSVLFVMSLLFFLYFIIVIMLKEILSMHDNTINVILLYSVTSFSILFYQIFNNCIEYPEAFVGISIMLYITNIISIGKIINTIFKKKVSVKSIWCISIINISFVIFSLTNIVFQLKNIYGGNYYSSELSSWSDALYFVVISFFTVGYGDLYPIRELSKLLSIVIIITGFVFSTVLVSTVLSITIEHFSNINKKDL